MRAKIILFICVFICISSASAIVTVDGIDYNLNESDRTAEVTHDVWHTYVGSVNIPPTINYNSKVYRVTSIGQGAFGSNVDLIAITIPNSVKTIGQNAFMNCFNLISITLGDSVTIISREAFMNCRSLDSLTLPKNISYINYDSFKGCDNIKSIIWKQKNCNCYNFGSQVESFCFGGEVEIIPEGICSGMSKVTSINIPNSVTSIGASAFSGTGLISIDIPQNITHIGENAFSGSPIHNVNYYAVDCEDMSGSLFDRWSITNITFGDKVKHIPANLCLYQALSSVTIPENIESIGSSAFLNCVHLKEIIWNARNCDVASSIFSSRNNLSDSIQTVTFGPQVQKIPNYICAGMRNLAYVNIPDSVIVIEDGAFCNCGNLVEVNIPNVLKTIGNEAFYYCENLTSINLPSTLTDSGKEAFYKCSAGLLQLL